MSFKFLTKTSLTRLDGDGDVSKSMLGAPGVSGCSGRGTEQSLLRSMLEAPRPMWMVVLLVANRETFCSFR